MSFDIDIIFLKYLEQIQPTKTLSYRIPSDRQFSSNFDFSV